MISHKGAFSRALAGGRLHLAAHSHHLWPDVSFAAHCQAWTDASALWDDKWARIMGEIVPEAQAWIARHLHLTDPAAIAFAPNTHEFVGRLLAEVPPGGRVLTTDGEFHSFARAAVRLEEAGRIAARRVPVAPFATFPARFAAEAASGGHALVFFSHVFFGSGYVVPDIPAMVASVPDGELVVVDGYHAFMARPVDCSAIAARAFYLAGGYKYAMAGEGACFMACPPGVLKRPLDTGWYAGFGAWDEAVTYPEDAGRFWGATFDPSGLYRLCAVMRWLDRVGETPASIAARVAGLQAAFVATMDRLAVPGLRAADLVVAPPLQRGNFLAYRSAEAAAMQQRLAAAGIVTDCRGDVLRIGFGLYHDPADVPLIVARVAAALA